ncbi:hypothetical protein BUALT_Bualt15G0028400 [Buddleja alternifolia]|uniref:Zinc knuckle CX2CX4HX4C domain-containing protein n=1 Tax=Buddleja alternifolia TaxID=168488 RepID=A0AAV6WA50_9LAMI|nr:hypothetical protein BUALT_Bualt15G0028400 [Buddleja alternifolia]
MDQELNNLARDFTLTDIEANRVSIPVDVCNPGEGYNPRILVGKITTDRRVNFQAFKDTVLEDSLTLNLEWSDIYVRVSGLPLSLMNKNVAKIIGDHMGVFVEMDMSKNDFFWDSTFRLRVRINVCKSILRFMLLSISGGHDLKLVFSYEKLLNFCYLCGIIGHIVDSCELRYQNSFVHPGEQTPYGPWLRASSRRTPMSGLPNFYKPAIGSTQGDGRSSGWKTPVDNRHEVQPRSNSPLYRPPHARRSTVMSGADNPNLTSNDVSGSRARCRLQLVDESDDDQNDDTTLALNRNSVTLPESLVPNLRVNQPPCPIYPSTLILLTCRGFSVNSVVDSQDTTSVLNEAAQPTFTQEQYRQLMQLLGTSSQDNTQNNASNMTTACVNNADEMILHSVNEDHDDSLHITIIETMGSHMSKNPIETSATNPITNLQYTTDLHSYETACQLDVDLQSFDTALQVRTHNVINTLAAGVEVRALSFDSLKEVTECLLEMNQEVVKVILDCKKDIWKNQELFDLVEEYFENSLKTLDFCTALEKCLKRARDSQLLIHVALQQFEEEDGVEGQKRYSKTLEELKVFKEAGDPFTDEFFQIFQSVYKQQILMLEKLQLRKNKLDKKIKSISSWRKVSSIIFAATFAAVLICSVVAAAMAAPPVAAALAAATSIPLGSMGKWIDSLLKNYENAVKGQKEIINSMNVGTYVTIKDLDNIRVLIERFEIEIESLLKTADFAANEEAVRFAVEEIKKKLDVFVKNTEELGVQADNCSRDIRRARTVILQRIIKHPNH